MGTGSGAEVALLIRECAFDEHGLVDGRWTNVSSCVRALGIGPGLPIRGREILRLTNSRKTHSLVPRPLQQQQQLLGGEQSPIDCRDSQSKLMS